MNCLRNPCAVRIITMMLLTVSDVDVALTALFMMNVWDKKTQHPGEVIYVVAIGLVSVGFFVYFLGILWFAPRQRFKVMSLVTDLMRTGKSDFVTSTYRKLPSGDIVDSKHPQFYDGEAVTVSLNSSVFPSGSRSRPGASNARTFYDLDAGSEQDQQTFRDGLVQWGVGPIWEAVEVQNARNCCNREHGTPLVRTAVFGFMAQPAPKDLGGIFNANALFSFSVGTFELVFGAMILAEDGLQLQTVLPLSVSTMSFVLSLLNVIWDFSGILMQVEAEERMAASIKNRIDASLEAEKMKLLQRKDKMSAEINKKYADAGVGGIVQKKSELDAVAKNYHQGLDALNQQIIAELQIELSQWKAKLQKERDLLRGKQLAEDPLADNAGDLLQNAMGDDAVMRRMCQQIIDQSRKDLEALDPSSHDYLERTRAICEDRDRKVSGVKEAMAPLLA